MKKKNQKFLISEPESLWIEEAQRDTKAFEKIFNKYYDMIFNYVLRRTCDINVAQDVTANTFLNALNYIKDFKWQGIPLSSWLYRIATNEVNLNHRKTKRTVPLEEKHINQLRDERRSDTHLLEAEESNRENQKFKRVCNAMSRLKFKYQTVLTLRYFEEKSLKEICEILELPENTVKTHIRRGLIQLRSIL